jgi:DNA-binding NarL/FixJ family response regulator
MKAPIRVLVIDDHTLFSESLMRLLQAEPDIQVMGHCTTVVDGRLRLKETPVDVVLLDYDLGDEIGTDLLRGTDLNASKFKVLIVTAGLSSDVARDTLKAGVGGVILKHSGPGQLMEAIHKVASGEMWLDSGTMRSLFAGSEEPPQAGTSAASLSGRQRQVLRGILDGLTNKEIALQMQVSETSIKATIQALFNKGGVRTRSQLVRVAIEKYSSEWLGK